MKRKLGGLALGAALLGFLAIPAWASGGQQPDYGGDPAVNGPACVDLFISDTVTPAYSAETGDFYGYLTAETPNLCKHVEYTLTVFYDSARGSGRIGSISGLGEDAVSCGQAGQCIQGGLSVPPVGGVEPSEVCVLWTTTNNDGAVLDRAPESPDGACPAGAAIASDGNGGVSYH